MWKSSETLIADLKVSADVNLLRRLYALRAYWRAAICGDGYSADAAWGSNVQMSPYGESVVSTLGDLLSDLPAADCRMALFMTFFHHDVLIDVQKSNYDALRDLFQSELLQEKVLLPFRYGRTLYDRFNDTYTGDRTDHLMAPEVDRLLRGTPVGVYQLGDLVSGPLGLLDSKELRYVPPSRELPLWHCSDTGCGTLHTVNLYRATIPVTEALTRIRRYLDSRVGPPSEWNSALTWRLRTDGYRHYVDLPPLIADCIVGSERTSLLTRALTGHTRDELRSILAKPPRKKSAAEGSPAEVAARLSKEAQLQLLLVLPDRELVDLIDQCVFAKEIKCTIGEVRELRYKVPSHVSDATSEISSLGIRSADPPPLVNLISAIRSIYRDLGLESELDWRIKRGNTTPGYEALVSYLREVGPGPAVRELILSSEQVTRRVCERFDIALAHVARGDAQTVDRLLWKMGLKPMRFDDSASRLKDRLSDLSNAVLVSTPIDDESARDSIRSAGVNAFVLLEEFLDRLISYNTWLLSSDHFLITDQHYSPVDARLSVPKVLGSSLSSGDTIQVWQTDSVNTLGTQLRYLRAAADWIAGLPDSQRDLLRRAQEDLPHFADDERRHFPFRHTALWADADPSELRLYSETFSRVVKLIEEAEAATVRNGLDHFREFDVFPSADKLLGCVARLTQAVEIAESCRLTPRIFWLHASRKDRFGSEEYEFRDSAGRKLALYGPALVSGMGRPSFDSAFLIAPGNLLGGPNSWLLFWYSDSSEFSSYWKGYPRRRRIVAAVAGNGGASSPGSAAQTTAAATD